MKSDDIQSDAEAGKMVEIDRVAGLWQVHGNTSVVVHDATNRTIKADGMATDTSDLLLTIRAADCQNFVLFDPVKNIVSVLHAGWRGMVTRAITKHIELLQREWKTNPVDLLVGAGPSLCTACAEFTDPLKELPGINPMFFRGRCVDLRSAADAELLACGVLPSSINRSPDCTKCLAENYWSYRGGDRQAVMDGHTNVLGIVIKKAPSP
jgi:YfiH family protein